MGGWEKREKKDDSGEKGKERRIRKKGEKQTDDGGLRGKRSTKKVGGGVRGGEGRGAVPTLVLWPEMSLLPEDPTLPTTVLPIFSGQLGLVPSSGRPPWALSGDLSLLPLCAHGSGRCYLGALCSGKNTGGGARQTHARFEFKLDHRCATLAKRPKHCTSISSARVTPVAPHRALEST